MLTNTHVFSRVLQLMNLTDSRLAQGGSEKLDLALLSFFEQFRKIYVGDQVQKTSKVRYFSCQTVLCTFQCHYMILHLKNAYYFVTAGVQKVIRSVRSER